MGEIRTIPPVLTRTEWNALLDHSLEKETSFIIRSGSASGLFEAISGSGVHAGKIAYSGSSILTVVTSTINSMTSGSILFKTGIYDFGTITDNAIILKSNMSLKGERGAVFRWNSGLSTGNKALVYATGKSNIEISGLEFDGKGALNQGALAIRTEGNSENVVIRNNIAYGISGTFASIVNTKKLLITENICPSGSPSSGSNQAFCGLDGITGSIISNNYSFVWDTFCLIARSANMLIVNNVSEGDSQGFATDLILQVPTDTLRNIIIDSNYFYNHGNMINLHDVDINNPGTAKNIRITNNILRLSGTVAHISMATGKSVEGLVISNNLIDGENFTNGGAGITFSSGIHEGYVITNNTIKHINSGSGNGTGIWDGGGSSATWKNFVISNNIIDDVGGKAIEAWMIISGSIIGNSLVPLTGSRTFNSFQIYNASGSVAIGNILTANIGSVPTTGGFKLLQNSGYVTKDSGYSSGSSGVSVSHTLSSQATKILVTASGSNPMLFSVAPPDNTRFNVYHTGSGIVYFYWEAEV